MSDYGFDLRPLIWFGAVIVLIIWGLFELVMWIFVSDDIRSTEPIKPKIELVIKKVDGKQVVDTVYVYQKP